MRCSILCVASSVSYNGPSENWNAKLDHWLIVGQIIKSENVIMKEIPLIANKNLSLHFSLNSFFLSGENSKCAHLTFKSSLVMKEWKNGMQNEMEWQSRWNERILVGNQQRGKQTQNRDRTLLVHSSEWTLILRETKEFAKCVQFCEESRTFLTFLPLTPNSLCWITQRKGNYGTKLEIIRGEEEFSVINLTPRANKE